MSDNSRDSNGHDKEDAVDIKMCKQYKEYMDQRGQKLPTIDSMEKFTPTDEDGVPVGQIWNSFLEGSWQHKLRVLRKTGYTDKELALGLGIKLQREEKLVLILNYGNGRASAEFNPRKKRDTEDEILRKCCLYENIPLVSQVGTEAEKRMNEIRLDIESQLTDIYREYQRERKETDSGNGNGKEKGVKRPYWVYKYSSGKEGHLFESVLVDGKPLFASYIDGKVQLFSSVEETTRELRPFYEISRNSSKPYSFQNVEELQTYIDRAKKINLDYLWKCVRWFVDNFFDGDVHDRNIIAIAIILGYFLDRLPSTFYLFPHGTPGSGKGAVQKLFKLLGYRVVLVVSPHAANIYDILGVVEKAQCSLCVDEASRLDEYPDIMDILKSGHKSGGNVPRILDASSSKRSTEFYFTFCMKVIGAERKMLEWKAEGLLTRIFHVKCIAGHPQFSIDKVEETGGDQTYEKLKSAFDDIHKLLFAYRLVHYTDPIADLRLNLEGREEELCAPAIRLFLNSSVLDIVKDTLFHFISERRDSKVDTFDHELFEAVFELVLEANQGTAVELRTSAIWETMRFKLDGTDIFDQKTGKVKQGSFMTQAFGEVTKSKVSTILTTRFATKSVRIGLDRSRGYLFDKAKLERAGRIYNQLNGIEILENISKDGQDAMDAYPGDRDIFADIINNEKKHNNDTNDAKNESDVVNPTENTMTDDVGNAWVSPETASVASCVSSDILEKKIIEEGNGKAQSTRSSPYEFWQAYCLIPLPKTQEKNSVKKIPANLLFQCQCPLCDFKFGNQDPDAAIYAVAITHAFLEHPGQKVGEILWERGYVTPSSVNCNNQSE